MSVPDSYLSKRITFLGANIQPNPITAREEKRRSDAQKAMRRLISTRISVIYQEAS